MRTVQLRLTLLAFLLAPLSASAVVTIDWVTVGNPGNACDPQSQGCFGAVSYEYRIGKLEITNAQYAEFLNAVAVTDANALYHPNMADTTTGERGGIIQSGSSGSFSYSLIQGRENMPVNWVSFWDATRFANWLHSGQPTGAQDNTTTEDGAYTLTPTDITNNTVMRNTGAKVFVPSEDEWYKTAYYDPVLDLYYIYPAGSDTQTTCAVPVATANTANCWFSVGAPLDVFDVKSYTGSASPYGTFDQGGNVSEWNEAIAPFQLSTGRVLRGGNFHFSATVGLQAADRISTFTTDNGDSVGFRVASPVPVSPPVPSLSPLGIAMLLSLLGLAGWRRLRA